MNKRPRQDVRCVYAAAGWACKWLPGSGLFGEEAEPQDDALHAAGSPAICTADFGGLLHTRYALTLASPCPPRFSPRARLLRDQIMRSPLSDLIQHPTLGSGPIASSVAGLFSTEDFENINKEIGGSQQSKTFKQAADFVLRDLRDNQRTP